MNSNDFYRGIGHIDRGGGNSQNDNRQNMYLKLTGRTAFSFACLFFSALLKRAGCGPIPSVPATGCGAATETSSDDSGFSCFFIKYRGTHPRTGNEKFTVSIKSRCARNENKETRRLGTLRQRKRKSGHASENAEGDNPWTSLW